MPTNRERLIASLRRRQRVVEEATRAMINDLEAAGADHWTFDAIGAELNEFLDTVELCIRSIPDPDAKYLTKTDSSLKYEP